MRHLFVTQDYAPDLGGMARRHVELCRRFAPDDVVVSTVASRDAGTFDAAERYPIHRQPFPFGRANRFINQMRWARDLVRERVHGLDILHCGNIRPCGYAVWWAHQRTRAPYFVYVYGGDLLREQRKTRERLAKRLSARAIFGLRCRMSMLFGTKPRFFFIASKASFSSGVCSGGSGAMRGEGFTFCSMGVPYVAPACVGGHVTESYEQKTQLRQS